jgi:hypothetical protein
MVNLELDHNSTRKPLRILELMDPEEDSLSEKNQMKEGKRHWAEDVNVNNYKNLNKEQLTLYYDRDEQRIKDLKM